MSTAEPTREEIDALVARLHDEYGAFRVFGDTVELGPERFDRLRRRIAGGTAVGVGCWTQRPDGDLLLVRDRNGPAVWEVPGGVVRADESLETAVRRRVSEQTAVEPAVQDLFAVRRRQVRSAGDEARLHTLWAVFDAVPRDDDAVPADEGSVRARWWDEHPGPVDERIQQWVKAWAAGHLPQATGDG